MLDSDAKPFTIFVHLRALPQWLALPRSERNSLSESAMDSALTTPCVTMRHFDAEAFTAACSDICVFEAPDLRQFYQVMERLRDSALFSVPYFELVQIIPSLQDGYRWFEQLEGEGAPHAV